MNTNRKAGFLIAKIHQSGGRILARKLKDHKVEEINPAQGRILFVLWEEDHLPIHELAKRTSLGKSTLTSMLDRLEKTGHLVRIPSEHDRRKIMVQLTPKNRALQQQYEQISQEMTDLFYAGLSPVEVSRFEQKLQRILENLEMWETQRRKAGTKA
jgi:DNA-binding MarR family transcriptional regulator